MEPPAPVRRISPAELAAAFLLDPARRLAAPVLTPNAELIDDEAPPSSDPPPSPPQPPASASAAAAPPTAAFNPPDRWTTEEEQKLRDIVGERGNVTSGVAELLGTGRSDLAVKQHWELMAKRAMAAPRTSDDEAAAERFAAAATEAAAEDAAAATEAAPAEPKKPFPDDDAEWFAVEDVMARVCRGAAVAPTAVRFARFKALRRATRAWAAATGASPADLFASVWRSATDDVAIPAQLSPSSNDGTFGSEATHLGAVVSHRAARAALASAFFLNTPRGGALDLVSGTAEDPLYVSAGTCAEAKLLALLYYFDATRDVEDGDGVGFKLWRAGDDEDASGDADRRVWFGAVGGITDVFPYPVLPPDATANFAASIFNGRGASATDLALYARPEALLAAHYFSAPLAANEAAAIFNAARRLDVGGAPLAVARRDPAYSAVVVADAPRSDDARAPEALAAAKLKCEAVAAALRVQGLGDGGGLPLCVDGPWGASTFLDAAEPVLRVVQLACACPDLRVDVDGFKPADAKRLLSISKALNARTAPAGEVMARMVRAADADAASPRATFGRDLVDYLRGLPRTPRDGDEPPPKRPKTD